MLLFEAIAGIGIIEVKLLKMGTFKKILCSLVEVMG